MKFTKIFSHLNHNTLIHAFVMLLVVLLTGCVNDPNAHVKNRFRGASIDNLFQTLGSPYRIEKLPNRHKILIYNQAYSGASGCEALFELDRTNHVVDLNYRGQNCIGTRSYINSKSVGMR